MGLQFNPMSGRSKPTLKPVVPVKGGGYSSTGAGLPSLGKSVVPTMHAATGKPKQAATKPMQKVLTPEEKKKQKENELKQKCQQADQSSQRAKALSEACSTREGQSDYNHIAAEVAHQEAKEANKGVPGRERMAAYHATWEKLHGKELKGRG